MDDRELLDLYRRTDSEEAFQAIVSRYQDMVYSVCLRHTGGREMAEDASQAVFMVLVSKARSLPTSTILSGWLFATARLTSSNALKMHARRIRHEKLAASAARHDGRNSPALVEGNAMNALNAAISKLNDSDRNAVILKYFNNKSTEETAGEMRISPDAARKRIERALTKLKQLLTRDGIDVEESTLVGMLSCAIAPAPSHAMAGLTGSAVTANLLGASPSALIAKGTLHAMLIAKLKIAASVAVVALLGGTAVVTAYSARGEEAQAPAPPAEAKPRSDVLAPAGFKLPPKEKDNDGWSVYKTDFFEVHFRDIAEEDAKTATESLAKGVASVLDSLKDLNAETLMKYPSFHLYLYPEEDDMVSRRSENLSTRTTGGRWTVTVKYLTPSKFALIEDDGPRRDEEFWARTFLDEYTQSLLLVLNKSKGGGWNYNQAQQWFTRGYRAYLGIMHSTETNRQEAISRFLDIQRKDSDRVKLAFGLEIRQPNTDGAVLLAFIHEHYGKDKAPKILLSKRQTFGEAVEEVLATDLNTFFKVFLAWRQDKFDKLEKLDKVKADKAPRGDF